VQAPVQARLMSHLAALRFAASDGAAETAMAAITDSPTNNDLVLILIVPSQETKDRSVHEFRALTTLLRRFHH
jgi:hypothetical protein